MKFKVTYPNGKTEISDSEAATPEAYAMMHFGCELQVAQANGAAVELLTETAPAETAPAETAPAETAPAETAPAETAPAETAPAETAPAETAPAETA
jgi:hypothetical protein